MTLCWNGICEAWFTYALIAEIVIGLLLILAVMLYGVYVMFGLRLGNEKMTKFDKWVLGEDYQEKFR